MPPKYKMTDKRGQALRIGMTSLHTSPLDTPGQGDAGGMNVCVLELAKHLGQLGHEVELLTLAPPGAPDRRQAAAPGVTLVELSLGLKQRVSKRELPGYLEAFRRRIQQQPGYNVFHSHYWLSAAAADPVARSWGVPHLVNFHTVAAVKNALLPAGDQPEQQLRLATERELAHSVSKIVASTSTEASSISHYYGIPRSQVVVVPPGVDTELFTPNPSAAISTGECSPALQELLADCFPARASAEAAEQAAARRRCFLLMLARVQPLKGQALAVQALAELRQLLPRGECPALVLAGAPLPHDSYAEYLRGEVSRLDLEDLIIFVDALPREVAAALLRRAALLLVPSFSETFGLVTLEAAASGTPTVAASTDGLIDSVVPQVTGFLVEGRSPQVWAQVIAEILQDPRSYEELSTAAVEYARSRDWSRTADQLSQVYWNLVS